MKRPTSLTLRLTLLFSAVATVVLLAFGWIIERSIDKHFEIEDIKEMNVIAQAVEKALTTLQPEHDITSIKQRFDDLLIGHHSPLLYITDENGKKIYTSSGPDLSGIHFKATGKNKIQKWKSGQHTYRVFTRQVAGKNGSLYTVTIAIAIDFHLHFITNFRYTLWLTVACGIIIMGLMGWIVVRHGHKPLHNIVEKISRISTNELNTRIAIDTVPIELTDLAESFNELLQRMEESFKRLSNFSADIAHELRTPITNLMTQTQVALSQARTTDEYQEILYSSMEEYERMAQMVSDMLFLAKADNTDTPLNIEQINLKKEINNLFDFYEAWAEESRISFKLEGDANIEGDRLMLRRALSNLLSNAVRHTPAGGCVTVTLTRHADDIQIVVTNPGNTIAPEHLTKIFDRFYRTDPSRQRSTEGAGLGLAIVKSIIEAHGGNIIATSDSRNTKFKITIMKSV